MAPTLCNSGLFQEGMFKELAASGWEMGWLEHTSPSLSSATYLQVLPTGSGCPPFFL